MSQQDPDKVFARCSLRQRAGLRLFLVMAGLVLAPRPLPATRRSGAAIIGTFTVPLAA